MDDFLEQMLSAIPWGDGISKATWDTVSVTRDSSCGSHGIAKLSSLPAIELSDLSQMHSQHPPNIPNHSLPETSMAAMALHLNTTSSMGHSMLPVQGLPLEHPPIVTSPLMGDHAFEGSASQHADLQNFAYEIGAIGQGKPAMLVLQGEPLPNGTHLGKRSRSDEEMPSESQQGAMGHVAPSLGLQSGQVFGDQISVGHSEVPTNYVGRLLRVRARRGQATDPHSIAERNRRERIAERMKALQQLVPDSNKTDKASMLDEIITYVKFLQMQVKCLSLCRLGGAGGSTAAPLFADFSKDGGGVKAASLGQLNGVPGCQDSIVIAERQVARLMDEDMSAAMQYLQSKGLCLMPISAAAAISSSSGRRGSGEGVGSRGGCGRQQQPGSRGFTHVTTAGSSNGSHREAKARACMPDNTMGDEEKDGVQQKGDSAASA